MHDCRRDRFEIGTHTDELLVSIALPDVKVRHDDTTVGWTRGIIGNGDLHHF
jgi:hypothetical protein